MPFETNKQGALLTDGNLRVLKQQRVFALGDVAGSEIEAQTANIPPTAQVSLGPCNGSLVSPLLSCFNFFLAVRVDSAAQRLIVRSVSRRLACLGRLAIH